MSSAPKSIFIVGFLFFIMDCQPETPSAPVPAMSNAENRQLSPYNTNQAAPIACPLDHDKGRNTDKKPNKPNKPNKIDSSLRQPVPFMGKQAYMAIRGNNFYTASSDYILTYSLNNSSGALTNKEQTFAPGSPATSPAPFNTALLQQNQLPANVMTQSFLQIEWTVVNGTAYLAALGYASNSGVYIATYTLDTTTDATSGQLINYQPLTLPQTESINDIEWVVVNNTAYLALYGYNSQYSEYFITMYTLDQTTGALVYNQQIFLTQFQSITQITWTVVNNVAYLGVYGVDSSVNQYFIFIYTLNPINGNLTNLQKTYMPTSEAITQIEWVVLNNKAYLGVNGYNILSGQAFIAIFTLNQVAGGLTNKQETSLLQQESCNQIEWVTVNNIAYLGFWGYDSFQSSPFLSTFLLNTVTGALTNRQKQYTSLGQTIDYIAWIVVNNKAFLAVPGYNNYQYMALISLYTFKQSSQTLTNLQTTYFANQTSINQIEWVVTNNKAYLGVMGLNNLQSIYYMSVFTLNQSSGALYNNQTKLSSTQNTFYQFEWVAL